MRAQGVLSVDLLSPNFCIISLKSVFSLQCHVRTGQQNDKLFRNVQKGVSAGEKRCGAESSYSFTTNLFTCTHYF